MTFQQICIKLVHMLVIRFQRVGRRNDPAFRIVVTEKRSKPKSSGLEILGSYHSKTKETVLRKERILYWLSKGAQTSPTVHNLLISKGVIEGKKIDVVSSKKTGELKEAGKTEKTSAVEHPETTKSETATLQKEETDEARPAA